MGQNHPVYRQELFDPADGAFSSRAVWSPGGEGWSGFLPADPQFEIVWTVAAGEVASPPRVVPPTPAPVFARAAPRG